MQADGWVWRTVPVYCTSSGRVLLFDHGRGELESLLAMTAFRRSGPNATRDVSDLYDRIVADRRRGYALVDEEFEAGLVAAAAPVRNFHGRIVAALNVSAPKFRFARRLRSSGETVKEAADELSRRLGWSGEHGGAGVAAGAARQ